ncbi:hypothetical protein FRC17_004002 [Serendipita sp. 399]|nr:hypothetical protein FRC17_004002 [Serendipita sp. 399]
MWNFGISAREENREKELRGKIGENIGIEGFMNTPESAQKIASDMDARWSRSVEASITTGFVDERKRLVPGNSPVSRAEKRGIRSQRDTTQRGNLATMREGDDDTTPAYDVSQRGGKELSEAREILTTGDDQEQTSTIPAVHWAF